MAHRFLTSPSYDGYFDFFTLAIVLTKYVKDHAATIQRALAWRPSDPSTPHELDIRALLAHEATHFLDMTTTNWGRQYVFRKLRFLSLIDTPGAKRNEAEKVFMIDTGEIDVHDHLLETGEIKPSACGTHATWDRLHGEVRCRPDHQVFFGWSGRAHRAVEHDFVT